MFDAHLIAEAREWLLDCGADPEDVEEATTLQIQREVDRTYCGGWRAFVRDGNA